MRWVSALFVAVSLTACGGGKGNGGARDIAAKVRAEQPIISASHTECHFDGERQVFANGVVTNGGDDVHNVSIEVRFLDADGVRIELLSDSVSDLQRGESAHWGVNFYPDHPGDVVKCDITTTAS